MKQPWWQLWSNQFTPSECLRIQEYAGKINPQQAVVGRDADKRSDEKIRRSEVRWFNRRDSNMDWLYNRISLCVQESNSRAWGFHLNGFHEIQHTTYPASIEGHYDWHEDLFWMDGKPSCRKVSVVIQLCKPNEYEGGRLELWRDNLSDGEFCNQGDMIIFPSFLRHRVTPVTKGVRNSLVTWVEGPSFR